ncbi:RNF4 ligase, partial [Dasyornis broadbenti]|nr:RNF4 ligase [Dasyornis broadbenti]
RKRRGGAVDSRPARKQSRLLPSSAGGTSQAELIDLEESGTPTFEPVIDLTGESPEPEDIIITREDDNTELQDREQSQQHPLGSRAADNSAELWASDNEEEPRDNDRYVTDEASLQRLISEMPAQPGVVIRCPICFEFYSEIVQNGQQLVATLCGHIFCSRCLPFALENAPVCPTCRADLPRELYIPIYL